MQLPLKIIVLILAIFNSFSFIGQELAFPGAEGFGRYSTGGRHGILYKVTNLNDSGEGSLRNGIELKEPRIIVFDVSGVIDLKSELKIKKGQISIFGQTAPAGGITIRGNKFSIRADDVIIRYLKFRLGDITNVETDALECKDSKNIIIDHVSVSWAVDENASFYRNENFTLQWSIISEALNKSIHKKGAHGYGGIWGGKKVSFHHNLLANNASRNPRFCGSRVSLNNVDSIVDFRNNVIYNWVNNSVYGGEKGSYNIVNNYYKPGFDTKKSVRETILTPYLEFGDFFIKGNIMHDNYEVSKNNWNGGIHIDDEDEGKGDLVPRKSPFDIKQNIKTQSAVKAFESVLSYSGASYRRDSIDLRVISEIKNPTFESKIIDSQEEVGGWCNDKLSFNTNTDSDNDGLPDEWEILMNLNPSIIDSMEKSLHSYYNNIEIYSHYILNN